MRARRPANTVVAPTTSIVLDGFPGSANSFAREAVLYCNPDASVASHIHTSAHLMEGLRLGKPSVLLVRPPVDAIVSFLSRGYRSELEAALHAYDRLHRRMLRHLDRFVVAPFDRTTQRFGEVVEEVNMRFGTALVPFPHDDRAARDAVFARLEAYTREVVADGSVMAATPTDAGARKARQAEVRAVLLEPSFDRLRERCEELYAQVCSTAPDVSRVVRLPQLAMKRSGAVATAV
ncbi:MAG TPA: hypothetical protein VGO03_03295 [Acidimicrobiia bacterium]|jgi:hypothetical protein